MKISKLIKLSIFYTIHKKKMTRTICSEIIRVEESLEFLEGQDVNKELKDKAKDNYNEELKVLEAIRDYRFSS